MKALFFVQIKFPIFKIRMPKQSSRAPSHAKEHGEIYAIRLLRLAGLPKQSSRAPFHAQKTPVKFVYCILDQ
jgi:hypothetical protein